MTTGATKKSHVKRMERGGWQAAGEEGEHGGGVKDTDSGQHTGGGERDVAAMARQHLAAALLLAPGAVQCKESHILALASTAKMGRSNTPLGK